jgi:triacylglycerol esterase/lipase EstA (alpha/beta hydrolase family)
MTIRNLFTLRQAATRAFAGLMLCVAGGAMSNVAHAQTSELSPAGANNWSCHPSAAHPRPVVLVHGSWSNMYENWSTLSPALAQKGYCVFALNYGGTQYNGNWVYATDHDAVSAQQLSDFVNRVLTATGATQVDIVGHSQGAMMPRYYLGFLGGAPKVHTLVQMAPDNRGLSFYGLSQVATLLVNLNPALTNLVIGSWCGACTDNLANSAFMNKLNGIGDTVPGVQYSVIVTRYDEAVTPYTSQYLYGPGVVNITIQDECSTDFVEHIGLAYDPISLHNVFNALDPANATTVSCSG